MKKLILVLLAFAAMSGCSYGGFAALGSDKVVVAKNSMIGGAMRTIYVCKVSDKGVSHCMDNESP
ncbi:MAG: hypothetical protein ACXVCH_14365 [Bdellovibrionota bacterium]